MIRFGAKVWILTASLLALIGLATDKASATQIGPNLVSPYEYGSDCATTVLVTYTAFPFPETGNVDFLASYNQPSSPCGAPGQQFTALQLRPAVGGGYTVVAEQPFTTSATTGPVQYTLAAPWHVQAGDIYAHLGQGIPIDIFSPNPLLNPPDPLYIASHVPVVGETITLGSGNFSTYPQSRDYYLVANFTPQAHVCVPPPPAMVGWWPGDGNANDIVDGNNGTLQGGATFAPGLVGQAFSLNGSSAFVDVGQSTVFNLDVMTLDAWVFIDPSTNTLDRRVISKETGSVANRKEFALKSSSRAWTGVDGTPQFEVLIGPGFNFERVSAPTALTAGWHHLAAVRDTTAGRFELYVDGLLVASKIPTVFGAIDSAVDTLIGAGGPSFSRGEFFDGLIDEVEIFNRGLSPAEILSILNAGSAGKCKTPPTCITPPSGMVSWWPGDGNANDIIGTNNGTLQGGVTFSPGEVGQAFDFNNGEVDVPHNSNQNMGSQMTIDAWVFPRSSGHGRPIAQKRSSGNVGGYTFETTNSPYGPDNGLQFVIWIGGILKYLVTPANALTIGTWQHVAATYDGTTMRIYVNGVEKANTPVSGAIDAVTSPFVMGRNVPTTSFAWDGLIDEVELFNRALSPEEILSIFNADTAGKCRNLPPPGPQPTTLSFTGVSATSHFDDAATVQARLTKTSDGSPVPSEMITFTLGSGSGALTCSATTDATGTAACSLTPNQPAGPQTLTADFAGDSTFGPSSTSTTFTVTKEETVTKFTATSSTLLANGLPATFSATLKEDGVTPISGRTLTFTLGSGAGAQSCSGASDASGTASCSIVVNQPLGPNTVKADFASDAFFKPSSDTEAVLVFAFLGGGGSFVIGDLNAAPGNAVTFWGAQWAKVNSLSGGPAPNAFKGFADQISTTPPACGGTFMADPGNSAPPPASVPAFMAVIDSSSISKSGSTISGNIPGIVIVKTNPGYAPNPGHAGTGTVVARLCGS